MGVLDILNVAVSGWGAVFPADCDPAIIEALRPLLEWRQRQAGERYREYSGDEGGVRRGERYRDWLVRQGASTRRFSQWKAAYFLLFVAGLDQVNLDFQLEAANKRAVGRICFDTPDEYRRYAEAVVAYEQSAARASGRAILLGVDNTDDQTSGLMTRSLVAPLPEWLGSRQPQNWQIEVRRGPEASKRAFASCLGGADTPDVLLTASHGMYFVSGSPQQRELNGALLCQDWPGPRAWRGPLPESFYFSAHDLPDRLEHPLTGLVSIHLASYSAGTPQEDPVVKNFLSGQSAVAAHPFVSRLGQRMLAHPSGGALSFIGLADRTWDYAYPFDAYPRNLEVYGALVLDAMRGIPMGHAMRRAYLVLAETQQQLNAKVEEAEFGEKVDENDLADLWVKVQTIKSLILLGDPAARLNTAR